jgi:hypothetical protein
MRQFNEITSSTGAKAGKGIPVPHRSMVFTWIIPPIGQKPIP